MPIFLISTPWLWCSSAATVANGLCRGASLQRCCKRMVSRWTLPGSLSTAEMEEEPSGLPLLWHHMRACAKLEPVSFTTSDTRVRNDTLPSCISDLTYCVLNLEGPDTEASGYSQAA
ncbi:hypothetical protein C8Q74DRAFT_1224806 [Fomes fomentarius]|nr:hypothetical protein C8Q74DRAFT_1224806 [Fomes fomentarius]